MTYTITSDDTGRSFSYPSEDAYNRAIEWYNRAGKAAIAYCEARGIDLRDHEQPGRLVDDWADIAMELWAREER